jgi:cell division septum initiation protein DivIVA
MQIKQPTTLREAKSMVKERWLDRRVEKLSKENDELREAVDELRRDLDEEHGRSKETLQALSKSKRPGRMKWLVLAGGAYVLGAKAGRARYEQIKGWTRSVTRSNGNGTATDMTTDTSGTSTGV